MGIGEVSALTAAACWATGSMLYSRIPLSAAGISFAKNSIGSMVLLVHLAIHSLVMQTPMFRADAASWLWLSLSGLMGIVIGDTFYFRSLQILGPRRALMVSTSSPVFAAILGWLFLSETVSIVSAVGMTLTLVGVAGVISDRRAEKESPGLFPGTISSGVVQGFLGAVFSAGGAVASRHGLSGSDPLEAAFIRILTSAMMGSVLVLFPGRLATITKTVLRPTVIRTFLPAVLLGTWLGIWLSQIAYKHSTVAIAMTLLSTTPLFATPLVRILSGVQITAWSVLSTVVAIAGVYLTVH
ncbi:MAG: DMT family transporter [Planctomycetaceae bacterium]|nr:DMT family transporter [Planctomycetaceae bacterium]